MPKAYDLTQVDFMEARTCDIREDLQFIRFKLVSPHAAAVIETSHGSQFGTSLDAAITEWEKFLQLEAADQL